MRNLRRPWRTVTPKSKRKPMMIMVHANVGLQHASMAIYNCYADRVPLYIVLGNILDVNFRRNNAEWVHSVQDAASMVRDFVKWDDTPVSLGHFAESAVRAYKIAMRLLTNRSSSSPMAPFRRSRLQINTFGSPSWYERASAGRFRRRYWKRPRCSSPLRTP